MAGTGSAEGKVFGFVSTRLAGTDGVSLEARKWAEVLGRMGHRCGWFAGRLDADLRPGRETPEAFFDHAENAWINKQIFGRPGRSRECTRRIQALKETLKDALYAFIEEYGVEVIVAQNCLTIPMHVPLGLALTEVIAETRLPTIAHHHDFYWERDRFTITAGSDYLQTAFPPKLACVQHVVINSSAREQLAHRTGLTSYIIPNVYDFDSPVPTIDGFASTFRRDIGLGEGDVLILQPTRVVSRKGIENAIELVRRLGAPRYKLVVSHEAGDEGLEYQEFIKDYAASVGVDLRIISQHICMIRENDKGGRRCYTLGDAYLNADLVTYPSLYEGFGNAFLEAVYFRKPLVVNRYSIFIRDIEPKGFQTVGMSGYVTRRVAEEVRRVLEDRAYREAMVDRNFERARKYFSYDVLARRLGYLLTTIFGLDGE